MNSDKDYLKVKIGVYVVILLLLAPHLLFIFMVYSSKLCIIAIHILREEGMEGLKKILLGSATMVGIVFYIVFTAVACAFIPWTFKIWMKIEYSKKGKFVPGKDDFWGIVKVVRKYPLPYLFLMLTLMITIPISLWSILYIWPKFGGVNFRELIGR